jgi:hypothetical protein
MLFIDLKNKITFDCNVVLYYLYVELDYIIIIITITIINTRLNIILSLIYKSLLMF